MKLRAFIIRTLLFTMPVGVFAQYPGQVEELTKVDVCVPLKAAAFNYSDVRLLDGPFKRAMEWISAG